jgi:hypothetical protein
MHNIFANVCMTTFVSSAAAGNSIYVQLPIMLTCEKIFFQTLCRCLVASRRAPITTPPGGRIRCTRVGQHWWQQGARLQCRVDERRRQHGIRWRRHRQRDRCPGRRMVRRPRPAARDRRRTTSVAVSRPLPSPSKEHIMTWRRQGLEMPIFIQFDQYPPHIGEGYNGRIRLVETTAIELSDLREQDEGWYECSLVSLEGSGVSRGDRASASNGDDSVVNGTWIYLAINGRRVSSLRVSTRLGFIRSSAADCSMKHSKLPVRFH